MQSIQVLKNVVRFSALLVLSLSAVCCSASDVDALKVGATAPDFSLPTYPTGQVALKDFQGKSNVVLAFYPKDQTPGCTKEMCTFSGDLGKYSGKNTTVLGISFDSVSSHEAFAQKHSLKQTLLADEGGKVAQLYGAAGPNSKAASRVLFLIDKNGVIQYVHKGMPDDAELIAAIDKVETSAQGSPEPSAK